MSTPFTHTLRVRYAEVDVQGVVFNAHWLTYFDDASTRFFEHLGYAPAVAFAQQFDLMVVKATLEWSGPAGFDDEVSIGVEATRLGTSSFDLTFRAAVGDHPACVGVTTYVSVVPGTHDPTPIPAGLRARLEPDGGA